jgi:hypothetical protein
VVVKGNGKQLILLTEGCGKTNSDLGLRQPAAAFRHAACCGRHMTAQHASQYTGRGERCLGLA